jgi:hypothetical protein
MGDLAIEADDWTTAVSSVSDVGFLSKAQSEQSKQRVQRKNHYIVICGRKWDSVPEATVTYAYASSRLRFFASYPLRQWKSSRIFLPCGPPRGQKKPPRLPAAAPAASRANSRPRSHACGKSTGSSARKTPRGRTSRSRKNRRTGVRDYKAIRTGPG